MSLMLSCPECGQKCRISPQLAGQNVRCPKCATVFAVPQDEPAPSVVETSPTPSAPAPTSEAPPTIASSGWVNDLTMTILARPDETASATTPPHEPPADPVSPEATTREPEEAVVAAELLDEEPPPPPSWRQARGGRSRSNSPVKRDARSANPEKKPRPTSRTALYLSLGFGVLILGSIITAFFLAVRPATFRTSQLDANGHFRHDGVLQTRPFGHTEERFAFSLSAGKGYVIQNQSRDFDALLTVEDERGAVLASDDDGGAMMGQNVNDSFLRFRPPVSGKYVVIASALNRRQGGRFALLVDEDRGQFVQKGPPFWQNKKPDFQVPGVRPASLVERLAFGPEGRAQVACTIGANDGYLNGRNSRCRVYEIELTQNKEYRFDLESVAFDAYLDVRNFQDGVLASDDDSGGNRNSRVTFRPPVTATYRVAVGPLFEGNFGVCVLKVEELNRKVAAQPVRQPVEGGTLRIENVLALGDPLHAATRSRFKVFSIEMKKQSVYEVTASSMAFDARIETLDHAKKPVGVATGSRAEARKASLRFNPEKDGVYEFRVSGNAPNQKGPFTLEIRDITGGEAPPAKEPIKKEAAAPRPGSEAKENAQVRVREDKPGEAPAKKE